MAVYLGLDVSDKTTHLCAVEGGGRIGWRGVCATDPETIARTIDRHCADVARVVLETGALSARLARLVVPDVAHHVTQRGNRRQPVFFGDDDYAFYRELVSEACAARESRGHYT